MIIRTKKDVGSTFAHRSSGTVLDRGIASMKQNCAMGKTIVWMVPMRRIAVSNEFLIALLSAHSKTFMSSPMVHPGTGRGKYGVEVEREKIEKKKRIQLKGNTNMFICSC